MENHKKQYFEFCTLCDKMYAKRCRTQHFKSRKHVELLLEKNLVNEQVEIWLYSLTNTTENEKEDEKEDENIYYLPNDS